MKSRLEEAKDRIKNKMQDPRCPGVVRSDILKILNEEIELEKSEDLGTLRKVMPQEAELSCFWQIKQIMDSMSDRGVGRVIAYFRDLSENGA